MRCVFSGGGAPRVCCPVATRGERPLRSSGPAAGWRWLAAPESRRRLRRFTPASSSSERSSRTRRIATSSGSTPVSSPTSPSPTMCRYGIWRRPKRSRSRCVDRPGTSSAGLRERPRRRRVRSRGRMQATVHQRRSESVRTRRAATCRAHVGGAQGERRRCRIRSDRGLFDRRGGSAHASPRRSSTSCTSTAITP